MQQAHLAASTPWINVSPVGSGVQQNEDGAGNPDEMMLETAAAIGDDEHDGAHDATPPTGDHHLVAKRLVLLRVRPNYILCCYNAGVGGGGETASSASKGAVPWGLLRRKARSLHAVLQRAALKLHNMDEAGVGSGVGAGVGRTGAGRPS